MILAFSKPLEIFSDTNDLRKGILDNAGTSYIAIFRKIFRKYLKYLENYIYFLNGPNTHKFKGCSLCDVCGGKVPFFLQNLIDSRLQWDILGFLFCVYFYMVKYI